MGMSGKARLPRRARPSVPTDRGSARMLSAADRLANTELGKRIAGLRAARGMSLDALGQEDGLLPGAVIAVAHAHVEAIRRVRRIRKAKA